MKPDTSTPKSVDEYISTFPPEIQKVLQKLRSTIRKAAPGAEERISYQMPAYSLHGILVWFAVARHHIGFYPGASGVEAFRSELAAYPLSKGTVRFPLGKPLPYGLIAKIVKFRAAENTKARGAKSKDK